MPNVVRAKFRCLSVTFDHRGGAKAVLKPVIAKSGDWPGGSEENAAFWAASPDGECEVSHAARDGFPFEAGAYYYIDLAHPRPVPSLHLGETVSGDWRLAEEARSADMLRVTFDLPWKAERDGATSGQLRIGIANRAAWEAFLGHAGTWWYVRFTRADVGNSGCPYTG